MPWTKSHLMAGIEYERFSSEFPLRMRDTKHDNFEWVNYHTCGGRCMMAGRRVPFFHSKCLRFRLYAISDALLAAGEYTYEPPADEEHRRFTRTRCLLAPKLNDVLQVRLPPEILTTIAGLLVRECAIITSEEESLGKSVSDTLIDLSRDVYASYHVVDGVRYATSLANSTSEMSEDEHHVLVRKAGHSVHKIWIAEDHRGIRCVKFCSSDGVLPGPTPIARSWWRSISAPHGIGEITVKTDVGGMFKCPRLG